MQRIPFTRYTIVSTPSPFGGAERNTAPARRLEIVPATARVMTVAIVPGVTRTDRSALVAQRRRTRTFSRHLRQSGACVDTFAQNPSPTPVATSVMATSQ